MESILDMIYEYLNRCNPAIYDMDNEITEKTEEKLKLLKNDFTEEQLEIIKEIIYDILFLSEKKAFSLGMRFGFQLFSEIYFD